MSAVFGESWADFPGGSAMLQLVSTDSAVRTHLAWLRPMSGLMLANLGLVSATLARLDQI